MGWNEFNRLSHFPLCSSLIWRFVSKCPYGTTCVNKSLIFTTILNYSARYISPLSMDDTAMLLQYSWCIHWGVAVAIKYLYGCENICCYGDRRGTDIGWTISQIPQCIGQISHNARFCNWNVSVTKGFIVGYGTGVLWDSCTRRLRVAHNTRPDWFIAKYHNTIRSRRSVTQATINYSLTLSRSLGDMTAGWEPRKIIQGICQINKQIYIKVPRKLMIICIYL